MTIRKRWNIRMRMMLMMARLYHFRTFLPGNPHHYTRKYNSNYHRNHNGLEKNPPTTTIRMTREELTNRHRCHHRHHHLPFRLLRFGNPAVRFNHMTITFSIIIRFDREEEEDVVVVPGLGYPFETLWNADGYVVNNKDYCDNNSNTTHPNRNASHPGSSPLIIRGKQCGILVPS